MSPAYLSCAVGGSNGGSRGSPKGGPEGGGPEGGGPEGGPRLVGLSSVSIRLVSACVHQQKKIPS